VLVVGEVGVEVEGLEGLVGRDRGGRGVVGVPGGDAAVRDAAGDGEVGFATSVVGCWEGGAGVERMVGRGVVAHLGGAGEVFAIAEGEVEVRHFLMWWTCELQSSSELPHMY
jgi:hypothetical protein